jgi:hypothetical protein
MTDTDPIEELADTLYDALYAITPYAEPHFADEREGLRTAVRAVLDEAAAQQWIQKQLEQTGIRAMDFRNGMHMELEPARRRVPRDVHHRHPAPRPRSPHPARSPAEGRSPRR